jgi:hypothetical protein
VRQKGERRRQRGETGGQKGGTRGDPREIETEPMTSGSHLSGRTKKEAEAILALILGIHMNIFVRTDARITDGVLIDIYYDAYYSVWNRNTTSFVPNSRSLDFFTSSLIVCFI